MNEKQPRLRYMCLILRNFLVGKSLHVLIFCRMSLIFVRENVMRKFRDFKNGILQWLSQTGMPGSLCSIYNDAFPALLGLFGMNEVNNSPPRKKSVEIAFNRVFSPEYGLCSGVVRMSFCSTSKQKDR